MGGHFTRHGHLKPEDIEDLQHLTKFSAEDIKLWYQGFLDEFPSGYINHDEMKSIYAQNYPNGDATKFADYAFRAFPKNENGQIDFKQFLRLVSTRSSGTLEEKLKWTFALYDLDCNGLITREGVHKVFDALYEMWDADENMPELTAWKIMSRVFTELDENNTGVLTFEQILEGAKNNAEIRGIFECN